MTVIYNIDQYTYTIEYILYFVNNLNARLSAVLPVMLFIIARCWSSVGRQGGMQQISLASGCWSQGTVVDEIGKGIQHLPLKHYHSTFFVFVFFFYFLSAKMNFNFLVLKFLLINAIWHVESKKTLGTRLILMSSLSKFVKFLLKNKTKQKT